MPTEQMPKKPRVNQALVLEAIVHLGESFHDLNLTVLRLHDGLAERALREEDFRLTLFRQLDGMDRRLLEMQQRVDSQFDVAWHEIDELGKQLIVVRLASAERATVVEARIARLEERMLLIERRQETPDVVA